MRNFSRFRCKPFQYLKFWRPLSSESQPDGDIRARLKDLEKKFVEISKELSVITKKFKDPFVFGAGVAGGVVSYALMNKRIGYLEKVFTAFRNATASDGFAMERRVTFLFLRILTVVWVLESKKIVETELDARMKSSLKEK